MKKIINTHSQIFMTLGIIFSIFTYRFAVIQTSNMGTIGFALISASCFICSAIAYNKE